jgi:uncharacterized protein YdeI (YjbR/CyaY-like superfamily)
LKSIANNKKNMNAHAEQFFNKTQKWKEEMNLLWEIIFKNNLQLVRQIRFSLANLNFILIFARLIFVKILFK